MTEKNVTERLRDLRTRANMSMEALAKNAGYKGASSYQRYEDPTLFQDEFIPRKVIDKISPSLIGKGEPPITSEELYSLAGVAGEPFAIKTLPVSGIVAAGAFLEADSQAEMLGDDTQPVPAHPSIPLEAQFAVRVFGTSINKLADDGDILVCSDPWKTGAELEDGDVVVVQRILNDGQQREYTAKKLRASDNGNWQLWPHSNDPRYVDPIEIGGENEDTVSIIGKVEWAMRRP